MNAEPYNRYNPQTLRTSTMLNLTCIKDFSQSRMVFTSTKGVYIEKGDNVVLMKATNLSDSDNLFWVLSINDDDSYGNDSYGYLVHLDSDDMNNYFE